MTSRVVEIQPRHYRRIDYDPEGREIGHEEIPPVIVAEIEQTTGRIVAITRLWYSYAYHVEAIDPILTAPSCEVVYLTDRVNNPRTDNLIPGMTDEAICDRARFNRQTRQFEVVRP